MATKCGSTPFRGEDRYSIAACSRAGSSFFGLLLFLLFLVLLFVFFFLFFGRLRLWRQRPVGLEHLAHLLDDALLGHNHTDFTAPVEFQLAQALTAHERGAAVANDGSDVKPEVGQFSRIDPRRTFSELAEHPDLHAFLRTLRELAQH